MLTSGGLLNDLTMENPQMRFVFLTKLSVKPWWTPSHIFLFHGYNLLHWQNLKNDHPQSERQTQRSHNRTSCPPLLLGSGGPAQPAEIAFIIGRVAQHIDALQQPAPHHAAPLVTERLKAPATVVVAHPTCAWERWKKNQIYSNKKKKQAVVTLKECIQPYQLLRRVIQGGSCELFHHWNRSLHCRSSQERYSQP